MITLGFDTFSNEFQVFLCVLCFVFSDWYLVFGFLCLLLLALSLTAFSYPRTLGSLNPGTLFLFRCLVHNFSNIFDSRVSLAVRDAITEHGHAEWTGSSNGLCPG